MKHVSSGRAFIRLRPKQNNTSEFIAEHQKYWTEKGAKLKAEKARKAKALTKSLKTNYKADYDVPDGEGYFNEQVMKAYEHNSGEMARLSEIVQNKDYDYQSRVRASNDLKKMQDTFDGLINLRDVHAKKYKEFSDLKKSGNFNEYLDKEKGDFYNNINMSKYRLNPKTLEFEFEDSDGAVKKMKSYEMTSLPAYSEEFNENVKVNAIIDGVAKIYHKTIKDGNKIKTNKADEITRANNIIKTAISEKPVVYATFLKRTRDILGSKDIIPEDMKFLLNTSPDKFTSEQEGKFIDFIRLNDVLPKTVDTIKTKEKPSTVIINRGGEQSKSKKQALHRIDVDSTVAQDTKDAIRGNYGIEMGIASPLKIERGGKKINIERVALKNNGSLSFYAYAPVRSLKSEEEKELDQLRGISNLEEQANIQKEISEKDPNRLNKKEKDIINKNPIGKLNRLNRLERIEKGQSEGLVELKEISGFDNYSTASISHSLLKQLDPDSEGGNDQILAEKIITYHRKQGGKVNKAIKNILSELGKPDPVSSDNDYRTTKSKKQTTKSPSNSKIPSFLR